MNTFHTKPKRIEVVEGSSFTVRYSIDKIVAADGTVHRDFSTFHFHFYARTDIDSPDTLFVLTTSSGNITAGVMYVEVTVPGSATSNLPHGFTFYGQLVAVDPVSGGHIPVWVDDAPVIEFYVWGALKPS